MSDDPFCNTQPPSRRQISRRFQIWPFVGFLFAFWIFSLQLAWEKSQGRQLIWHWLVAVVLVLPVILQIRHWTKQVHKDLEYLDGQVRGLSQTVIQQAAEIRELKKELAA